MHLLSILGYFALFWISMLVFRGCKSYCKYYTPHDAWRIRQGLMLRIPLATVRTQTMQVGSVAQVMSGHVAPPRDPGSPSENGFHGTSLNTMFFWEVIEHPFITIWEYDDWCLGSIKKLERSGGFFGKVRNLMEFISDFP